MPLIQYAGRQNNKLCTSFWVPAAFKEVEEQVLCSLIDIKIASVRTKQTFA